MSNQVAGDISCADIQVQKASADSIFKDGGEQAKQYIPYADTAKAILANQTARFVELEGQKDKTISLYWINDCESGEGDCENDCIVGGPELSTDCKNYELDLCTSFGFNTKEKVYRTSLLNREDVIAKGMLSTEKKLDEWVNRQIIAKLDLLAGDNLAPSTANHVVDNAGNVTYIPAHLWDASLNADFMQDMVLNRIPSAFLLSGSNLFKANYLANKRAGDASGSGDAELFKEFTKYHDLAWLDSELAAKKTFLINPNAIAVGNKAYYPTTPTEYKGTVGQIRWSKASRTLPGIVYDWIYTLSCANNDIVHKYSAYVKLGVWGSPLDCNGVSTGILAYECGTGA